MPDRRIAGSSECRASTPSRRRVATPARRLSGAAGHPRTAARRAARPPAAARERPTGRSLPTTKGPAISALARLRDEIAAEAATRGIDHDDDTLAAAAAAIVHDALRLAAAQLHQQPAWSSRRADDAVDQLAAVVGAATARHWRDLARVGAFELVRADARTCLRCAGDDTHGVHTGAVTTGAADALRDLAAV